MDGYTDRQAECNMSSPSLRSKGHNYDNLLLLDTTDLHSAVPL